LIRIKLSIKFYLKMNESLLAWRFLALGGVRARSAEQDIPMVLDAWPRYTTFG